MSSPEGPKAKLRQAALEYREFPRHGKLAVVATKQLPNQRDLALAYSPGAAICLRGNPRPPRRCVPLLRRPWAFSRRGEQTVKPA